MALLVDGNISNLGDLFAYDSGAAEAARNEGADLSHKLKVAEQEINLELTAFLLRHREKVPQMPSGEPNLASIVVTQGLRQWHTLKSLSLLYGDAYNSQLNDRYLGKHQHFEKEAKRAAEKYFETGVGITYDPIPRARQPEVVVVSSGLPAATYAVSVAWRNAKGERGEPSPPMVYRTGDGEGFQVRGLDPPEGVDSYDVFVGDSDRETMRQNASPVPVGDWWTFPGGGLIGGEVATNGQEPSYFIRHGRILRRG
jgi:hypothetical protein